MNNGSSLWPIPFHNRFCNRPQSLRWDLTVPYRSSTFLQVICLIVSATQLTAVLHAGFRVTCHSFLNLRLCFSRLSRKSRSLIFLLDSKNAEAIEVVKSRAALSVSSLELIWILGEIHSETRLWNRSQSVTLLPLLFSCLLGFPCDRYKASPLKRWWLPRK
jgi:hypothetical protein